MDNHYFAGLCVWSGHDRTTTNLSQMLFEYMILSLNLITAILINLSRVLLIMRVSANLLVELVRGALPLTFQRKGGCLTEGDTGGLRSGVGKVRLFE